MPVLCARITPDDIKRLPCHADSLAEAALADPEGVYTVARTYDQDKVVLFDAHLDRLEDSAEREGLSVHLDRPRIRRVLKDLVQAAGFPETRMRLTVPKDAPDVLSVALERLPPLPDSYRQDGVKAVSVVFARSHPRVKSNRLEGLRAQVRSRMPDYAYEGLITGPRGEILEGLSSNFYAISGGVLRTADTFVLHGISRQIVLAVAEGRLPVQLDPIAQADIPETDEAFMSSSSRGILPVVEINEMRIGNGRPGGVTRELMASYDAWVDSHCEPLWETG